MYHLWIRLRQRKFNQEEWKNDAYSRRYFYHDIIKSRMLIGNNIYECGRLLGTKNREVCYKESWKLEDLKEWKYPLYKNICNGKTCNLVIHFANGKVNKVSTVFHD